MNVFANTIAIVTGGASGIGRALCEELSRRGGVTIVTDINLAGAEQVASSIRNAGGRSEAVCLDVSRAADVERIVREVTAKHGRLDYMFNNAAVAVVGELRDATPLEWKRIIDVNLMGVIYGSMAAYAVMIPQRSGHIINILP